MLFQSQNQFLAKVFLIFSAPTMCKLFSWILLVIRLLMDWGSSTHVVMNVVSLAFTVFDCGYKRYKLAEIF